MTALVINASIQREKSITRQLTQQLVTQLTAKGKSMIERDLTTMTFLTEASFTAAGTAKENRTQEQQELAQLSDTLIEELQQADTIIIGAPVYNFGPPAALKAWADLVARAGTTFKYTENGPQGLLQGKKAYILAASGGTAMGSEIDFMSPWLILFLGFIGIKDVQLIAADGTSRDGDDKITKAKKAIENIT